MSSGALAGGNFVAQVDTTLALILTSLAQSDETTRLRKIRPRVLIKSTEVKTWKRLSSIFFAKT